MAKANDRFMTAAQQLGLDPQFELYPEGTRTAVDAAAAVGCDVAQIVKSLVFVADGSPVLALTSGANRVDLKVLAAAVGSGNVRQANADEVRDATGFAIGGTPPFGHTTVIRTVIDPDLLDFDTVWAAAGTPDSCFPIVPSELIAAADAAIVDFAQR